MTSGETTAATASRFLVWAALVSGLAFALLTPPFEVPDEPAHFFRIVAIEEGQWFTSRRQGAGGQELPRWSTETAARWVDSIPGDETKKIRWRDLVADLRAGRPAGRVFVPVSPPGKVSRLGYSAASYSPLPYLLPAAVVAAGDRMGWSPLLLLLAARITNLGLSLGLLYFAVRVAGAAAPLMTLLALTPMAAFMRSSASADGVTMAAGFLIISISLRYWSMDGPLSRSDVVAGIALPILVCLTKPNIPLALLPLTVPATRFRTKASAWVFRIAVALSTIAGLATASVWGRDAASASPELASLTSIQLGALLDHPLVFTRLLAVTYLDYSPRYFAEMIGKLGWMDTYLPGSLIVFFYALLLYVAITAGPELTGRQRALCLGYAVAAILTVVVAIQVTWNSPGNHIIDGIQGRYFLPMAPLLLLPLTAKRLRRPLDRVAFAAIATGVSAALAGSLIVLVRRFYW